MAVALSSVGFNYFFTQPLYTLYIESADRPVFVVFLLFAFVIASFSSRRRRIEHDLRQARDELESERKQGEDVIIVPAVSDADAKQAYPGGWKAPKPYIRIVPQPR